MQVYRIWKNKGFNVKRMASLLRGTKIKCGSIAHKKHAVIRI